MERTEYDVAVIGGSFAGLAAAMMLARGRRHVAVFDHGLTRNRFADAGHGFLGMDGMAPGAMRLKARGEVLAYPTARVIETEVTGVTGQADDFRLETASGPVTVRRLVLAYGMRDTLPAIPGLAERWGASAIMCPYCHGYEAADRPTGLLLADPGLAEHALFLAEWAPDMVLFANGLPVPGPVRGRLAARGISVEDIPVAALEGPGRDLSAVVLKDGRRIPREVLYLAARYQPATPFAEALGVRMVEGPMGRHVATGPMGATDVPGIFAAGDLTRQMFNATLSAAEGAMAGANCHRSLVFGVQKQAA